MRWPPPVLAGADIRNGQKAGAQLFMHSFGHDADLSGN